MWSKRLSRSFESSLKRVEPAWPRAGSGSIPLVEERLEVGKRQVDRPACGFRVEVDEREEVVPAKLAPTKSRSSASPGTSRSPSFRPSGSKAIRTIIPVVEEQLVVEKRLVLVEEIHVHRKTTSVVEGVPVTLRSERAEIEREGAALDRAPAARQ